MAKTGKKNSVIEKTEKALKTWSNQAATALENVRSDYMEDLQTFNNVHESATNMMNDVGEKFYKLSKVAEQVKEHDPTEGANVKVTEEKDKWRVNPYLKKHPLSIMKVFRKGTDAQAWPPIQKETIEVEIDKTTQELIGDALLGIKQMDTNLDSQVSAMEAEIDRAKDVYQNLFKMREKMLTDKKTFKDEMDKALEINTVAESKLKTYIDNYEGDTKDLNYQQETLRLKKDARTSGLMVKKYKAKIGAIDEIFENMGDYEDTYEMFADEILPGAYEEINKIKEKLKHHYSHLEAVTPIQQLTLSAGQIGMAAADIYTKTRVCINTATLQGGAIKLFLKAANQKLSKKLITDDVKSVARGFLEAADHIDLEDGAMQNPKQYVENQISSVIDDKDIEEASYEVVNEADSQGK